jgi:hypothetical protein
LGSASFGQNFAIIGDFGTGSSQELSVANAIKSTNPAFVVTTGDNIYGSTNYAGLVGGQYYGNYITTDSTTNKFFPSVGNHDYSDAGINTYLSYFSALPKNNVTNTSTYYSVKQGDVEFFMLDANTGEGVNSAQYNWLNAAARASTAAWQVAVFHQPAYTYASSHGPQTNMQWDFKAMGIDAVFNGHNHNMQAMTIDGSTVSGLNTGLRNFVIGSSGNSSLYSISGGPNNATGDFSNASTFGYIAASATATSFSVSFKDTSNNTLYTTNLTQNSPTTGLASGGTGGTGGGGTTPPPAGSTSLSATGYAQNFDAMGTGTNTPDGWKHFVTNFGGNTTWTTAIPASGTNSVASMPVSTAGTTLTFTTTPTTNNNNGFNAQGSSASDRVLATAPTTVAGAILQLQLSNDTGSSVTGLNVGYDIRRYNAVSSTNELPGFQLFWSIDGGTSWTNVSSLNPVSTGTTGIVVPNTVGVTSVSSTPFYFGGSNVSPGSSIILRWVDDNAAQTSPDQIIGLDNVLISPRFDAAPPPPLPTPATPAVSLTLGAPTVTQNFNSLPASGNTAPPTGWRQFGFGTSHSTFTAATGIPVSALASVPVNTASTTLTTVATIDQTTNHVSNVNGFNTGNPFGAAGDRAIATSPTGDDANVIQFGMQNNTPFPITGFKISYDIVRFTYGAAENNGGLGTPPDYSKGYEELPGYQLFYSINNGQSWVNVNTLNPTLTGANGTIAVPYNAGVTSVPLTNVSITGGTVANGGYLFLRWVDDNGVVSSPDQIIGLDNVNLQPIAWGVKVSTTSGVTPAFAVTGGGAGNYDLAVYSPDGPAGLASGSVNFAFQPPNTAVGATVKVALDLVGSDTDIANLIAALDLDLPIDPLFGNGWDAMIVLNSPNDLYRLDWNFAGSGVTLGRFAVIPEPTFVGLLLPLAAGLTSRRRR